MGEAQQALSLDWSQMNVAPHPARHPTHFDFRDGECNIPANAVCEASFTGAFMSDTVANAEASAPLSQVERVVDTFIAPTKTFNDILRDSSWWLPWLLGVLVTLGFGLAIQQKIGWDKTYNNILLQSPQAQQDRLAQLPPDQQARQKAIGASFVKYIFWTTPVLILVYAAIAAAGLLGTLNFGLGGHAKFGQVFAVWLYATLPFVIQGILAIVTIFAGLDADSFNLKNPVGTNVGYFLPMDSPKWLMAFGTSIDILTIWVLILLTIGCAIVGKMKTGTAAVAVWGWWILITLVKVGLAGMF
jgi:Yip1 domain